MRRIKPTKELYLAKNLNELKSLCPIKKEVKFEQLSHALTKVYKTAEDAMLEGDEERAYIYLMRYFDLLMSNQKKPGFEQHKEYILALLGGNASIKITLDKLELLSKNLEDRYEEMYPTHNEPKFESLDLDDSIPASQPKIPATIEADEFFRLLKDPSTNMLILDCRPQSDYEQSRIKYQTMINVPEEILVKGVTVSKIKDQLSGADVALWASRAQKNRLILLDYRSCDFDQETPLWVMKDVLENWDNDFDGKPPIQLVSGGYENFKLLYPMECENPNYEPKPKEPQVLQLMEIHYPDLEYYDQTVPQASTLSVGPLVDRSKKLDAIKTYEDNKKRLESIRNQKEKNIDQSLSLEKELVQNEKKWQEMQAIPENELLRQELESEILQKETKIQELVEEVERLKRNEKEVFEVISEKDKTIMEERNKRRQLEEKERERKKFEEQQKQLAIERQRILAENRRAMRQSSQDYDEPELQLVQRPTTVPEFDRNTKPLNIQERHRDFSPVGKANGLGLTGLKNLGNTCYMNSIIQCLGHTKLLADYFCNNMYIRHRNRLSKTQCKIGEEVAAVIKALRGGHKYISSKDLKAIVGQYEKSFRGYDQQDSHEFLTILMDWLHSDLQFDQTHQSRPNSASEKAWNEFTNNRDSIILRLFYGQMKSTVTCTTCQKQSITYDTFSNLSLELPSVTNRCHLLNCLELFFAGDRVSGWLCPTCKQKRDAQKKLEISRLPGVLVIHLKRFSADMEISGYRKRQNMVQFPLKHLDVRSFVAQTELKNQVNTKTVYSLYAVSNHYGSMEGGHYTAYCKNNGRWYKFDDHQVSPIDNNEVVSSAAYILFYELASPDEIQPRTY